MKLDQRINEEKYAMAWAQLWSQYPLEHKTLNCLQERIGYNFLNPPLLFEALSHRSAVASLNTRGPQGTASKISLPWNERVEFLGDAVLNLVISTYLWNLEEIYSEGDLSRIRSSLVNEKSLAQIAREFHLADSILLGKGEEKAGGRKRDALLADTLEAVIGAVYQDGGFVAASKVIHKLFENTLARPFIHAVCDYKTRLQEWAQDVFRKTPNYKLMSQSGPDHSKDFVVAVCLDELELAQGEGQSKKRASQSAAENALKKINIRSDTTNASLEDIFADSLNEK
ncbi:MAG: ribonuclease III [Oligoflexales bacterium]